MLKRINDFFAGLSMTVVGGISLVASFGLSMMNIRIWADPAWIAVIVCGLPLLYLALWRVIHNPGIRKISSALLIVIAMVAALLIGDLFAAGEVAFIMALGALLEEKTTRRAQKGLRKLISLTPQRARRIVEETEELILAEQIQKDDIVRILPGEVIPVDGEILEGNTSVDQSVMTGESLPVDKEPGDSVFCGTMNCFGAVDIRATRVGEDGSLQKLIRMVEDAEKKQAPMQRIADTCASWLVPAALFIAIAAYLFTGDIVRGVTVLVVFCPCALVLATPTAIMAAIGQATKHGVIIKSGEALEKMGKVDTVAFDKTGTLTCGTLAVSDVISFQPQYQKEELFALAAAAESRSDHPLGRAIVVRALERHLELPAVEAFQMHAGKGICARVENRELFCGNERYLQEHDIALTDREVSVLEELRQQGKASVLIAVDGVCAGVIALSDILREDAVKVMEELPTLQTKTVLLTGDHKSTAEYFAGQAGISCVCAELLPGEKAESIEKLQKDKKIVCMIGDGVNDAPALKLADVGVAMGGLGSDIAVEAADIVLMSDDIAKLPYLKRLSNATVRTIKFSIGLSLCINFTAILCSVAGILTPTTGALVHNAGSCLVVLIAALLYDRKFDKKSERS